MRINTTTRTLTAVILTGVFATTGMAAATPANKLTVTEYGKSGKWTLRKATTRDGRVQSCDAFVLTGSETGLRFEYNRDTSSISFTGLGSAADEKPTNVEIWFDNDRAESHAELMSLETDMRGYPWRTHRSTNMELDVLSDPFSNLKRIHFAYKVEGEGVHDESLLLSGSNPAVKKTIDCVQKAAAARTAPRALPKPRL